MQTLAFVFIWQVLVFCSSKASLTHGSVSVPPGCFFSLKSSWTVLQTHVNSAHNHDRVWNHPKALFVFVLGLSRHLMALGHSECLQAGPVPPRRITWIKIRFADGILLTKESSHNEFLLSGVSETDGKQSEATTDIYQDTRSEITTFCAGKQISFAF